MAQGNKIIQKCFTNVKHTMQHCGSILKENGHNRLIAQLNPQWYVIVFWTLLESKYSNTTWYMLIFWILFSDGRQRLFNMNDLNSNHHNDGWSTTNRSSILSHDFFNIKSMSYKQKGARYDLFLFMDFSFYFLIMIWLLLWCICCILNEKYIHSNNDVGMRKNSNDNNNENALSMKWMNNNNSNRRYAWSFYVQG